MSAPGAHVRLWLRPQGKGFLTETELKQLNAIFSRILPADHARQIPSAVEAGASNFVSQLLARDATIYWEIPDWRLLYRQALASLDSYAKATWQRALIELDGQQIDQLIADLESGSLDGLDAAIDQKRLFATLRRHCLQGCFADPRWGGNKGKVMWRALGYLQPAEDLYHE